jgi:hypothetical protein
MADTRGRSLSNWTRGIDGESISANQVKKKNRLSIQDVQPQESAPPETTDPSYPPPIKRRKRKTAVRDPTLPCDRCGHPRGDGYGAYTMDGVVKVACSGKWRLSRTLVGHISRDSVSIISYQEQEGKTSIAIWKKSKC